MIQQSGPLAGNFRSENGASMEGSASFNSRGLKMCREKIRFGIASIFALTIFSPLFAADMPVKAPPPAPRVVYDWTGFYVGGEAGGKWTTDKWTTTCVDAGGPPLGTCGSAVSLAAFPGAPDATANTSFKTSGFRAGVYGGMLFQVNTSWVVGLEADWGFYNKTARVPGCLVVPQPRAVAVLSSLSI